MSLQIPIIAFHCVNCGSFDVQIRPRAPVSKGAQEWHHPNSGVGKFSPDQDDLEGFCLNCNSTDWDAIEEGNDWWDDFREWCSELNNTLVQPT